MEQILIIGGNGFIGKHLVEWLKNNTRFEIYILDSFLSSECPLSLLPLEWTLLSKRVYIKYGDSKDIYLSCEELSPKFVFHFGEFSRINESWNDPNFVISNNILGTSAVVSYCLFKNSFLIYSASSAILGEVHDATPYTFTKRSNVELIKNYERWFNLRYMITYFYNVYGEDQIDEGNWATVIGIFMKQYRLGKSLTIVKPGTQQRCFTHVSDIISGIMYAIDLIKNEKISTKDIPIFSHDEISIIDLAKLISDNITFVEQRKGDRLTSIKSLPDILRNHGWNSKVNLKEWLTNQNGLE